MARKGVAEGAGGDRDPQPCSVQPGKRAKGLGGAGAHPRHPPRGFCVGIESLSDSRAEVKKREKGKALFPPFFILSTPGWWKCLGCSGIMAGSCLTQRWKRKRWNVTKQGEMFGFGCRMVGVHKGEREFLQMGGM